MRPDPRVRRDGLCAQCRRPRKMPKPQKGVDPGEYLRDSFCSATCCRSWHGVSFTVVLTNEKRGKHERVAA